MKIFYDRVNDLELSFGHEYLLLTLIYKSFISHWPDRLFLAAFGKDPQRKRSSDDLISHEQAEPNSNATDRTEAASQHQTSSSQSQDQPSAVTPKDAKMLKLPNGTEIDTTTFFNVGNPPGRRFTLLNKICLRILKPAPPETIESLREKESLGQRQIMPFADNFETLTLPIMVVLQHMLYFSVIGILLAAGIWSVELTIQKNNIADVNHLPSAAQLIPFMIGIGSVCISGFSALGGFGAWLMLMIKIRKGITFSQFLLR